jgi:hypothetical protein
VVKTKIKKLLEKKGLRARVFNLELGISEPTVYRFINRRAILPRHWHEGFANILGVAADDIIGADGLAILDDSD